MWKQILVCGDDLSCQGDVFQEVESADFCLAFSGSGELHAEEPLFVRVTGTEGMTPGKVIARGGSEHQSQPQHAYRGIRNWWINLH